MATLASVVRKYQQQGQGKAGALTSGASDILKEMIDPRRFLFKSDGIMTTLFPSLRAFKAKGAGEKGDLLSSGSSAATPVLSEILINSEITAKNTAVLPMMGRDMNVMRQGILKLVKLQGGTQRDKADRFFMSARDREALYESQFGKRTGKSITPTKQEGKEKESILTKILKGLGILEIIRDLMPLLRLISGVALPVLSTLLGTLLPIIVGTAAIASLTQLFRDWKKGKEEKEDLAYLRKLKDEGKELTPAQQSKLTESEKSDKSVTPGEATRKATKGSMTLGTAKQFLESDLTEEEIKDATGASRKVLEEYVKRGGKTALRELSLEMGETPGGKTRAPKAEKGKAAAGETRAKRVEVDPSLDKSIQEILSTIRTRESGGNYNAQAPGSTASGAYQFIDSTWQSLTKKYGIGQEYNKAKDAPPEIQDSVAGKYVQDILKQNGGDVSKVPLVWYTGNAQGKMSNQALAANSGLTPETYQQKWMETYSKVSGGATMASTPVPSTTGNKVNATSREVAVAQRTEGNEKAQTVIDNRTTNNTQMAGNSNQNKNVASPYNEDLYEMMVSAAIG